MDFKHLNSLLAVQKNFNTDDVCRKHLENVLWDGEPICPHCKNVGSYTLKDNRSYRCKNKECKKTFTVTVGTIFDNTKIPLPKWFAAMYLVTSHKKGISSCQLAKDIEISQHSAWFVLGRIREMLRTPSNGEITTTVEIDETYVGGKNKNRHSNKKLPGTGTANKTMVFGILERNGNVQNFMVDANDGKTLQPIINDKLGKGATIITDTHGAYKDIDRTPDKDYRHEAVNHSGGEYVRDSYHTNNIEGYWGGLKRGIYGIYHHVTSKHLHRYCNEFGFRYNTRKQSEGERFNNALLQAAKRLRYYDLIEKDVVS